MLGPNTNHSGAHATPKYLRYSNLNLVGLRHILALRRPSDANWSFLFNAPNQTGSLPSVHPSSTQAQKTIGLVPFLIGYIYHIMSSCTVSVTVSESASLIWLHSISARLSQRVYKRQISICIDEFIGSISGRPGVKQARNPSCSTASVNRFLAPAPTAWLSRCDSCRDFGHDQKQEGLRSLGRTYA